MAPSFSDSWASDVDFRHFRMTNNPGDGVDKRTRYESLSTRAYDEVGVPVENSEEVPIGVPIWGTAKHTNVRRWRRYRDKAGWHSATRTIKPLLPRVTQHGTDGETSL